ncbi:MAG: tRNA uracil 4-sulfurtransferase ThiI [Candidatus Micrarchaeota archaeon]
MLYTVHCSEISLKGRNRPVFENMLVSNIRNALENKIQKIRKMEKRIYFESDLAENHVKDALSHVFGIEWYARVHEVNKNKREIESFVLDYFISNKLGGKTIKVETKRGDKKLPFTSIELNQEIGAVLVEKLCCKANMRNPDLRIYIEIMQQNKAFVHFEKIRAFGGLPIGTSKKVVALLSGGIDSCVASWMIMKRGAKVIFLHVHPFANEDEAKKSKIIELIKSLARWQNNATAYFANYSEFYKKTLALPPKYELVMFRKFIYLLAQKIAEREGALAIVSGDSLGQVASQTLENIYAINDGITIPIFRPLIGMNKKEIIEIAEKIGTFQISIIPYKDCCSLVAISNPETKADANIVRKLSIDIDMEEIIEKTVANCSVYKIGTATV